MKNIRKGNLGMYNLVSFLTIYYRLRIKKDKYSKIFNYHNFIGLLKMCCMKILVKSVEFLTVLYAWRFVLPSMGSPSPAVISMS